MGKHYLTFLFFSFSLSIFAQDIYDVRSVKDVKIQFEFDDWKNQLNDFKEAGKDERLIGTVTVNGTRYDSVGVRYKGNSSYFNVRNTGSSKLPFNIKVNHIKKKQKLPNGYTSLKLSNVFRDPSFLREVLAYEIAGKYMPSPRANYVRVYVNDQLLGLYNNTESVDEKFLKENFGNDDGTLVKCDPNWHGEVKRGCKKGNNGSLNYLGDNPNCYFDYYEKKSDKGWKDLVNLTKVLETNTKDIEKVLNVDRALWMLAYNNVLVNLDSYSGRLCHNYYVYKDENGIFNTIPWDMNLNFGGFRFVDEKTLLDVKKMQELSPLSSFKDPKRPLISKLLANSMYRKIYIAHMRTILKENFSSGEYAKRATEIQRIIDFFVKSDENKLYPYEEFKNNLTKTSPAGKSKIVGITELMNARTKYLEAHPLINKTPPKISQVKHTKGTDGTTVTAKVEGVRKAFVFYREKGFGTFKRVALEDDGNNAFSVKIPKDKPMEYYIMALNADAAMFSPERAAFEVYEVK